MAQQQWQAILLLIPNEIDAHSEFEIEELGVYGQYYRPFPLCNILCHDAQVPSCR